MRWFKKSGSSRLSGVHAPVRIGLMCFLAAWAVLSPAPAQADDAPRRHVTIPFTHLPGHGHIVVRVRFNDTLTGNFLLDTGSFASLMDEQFAKKLGIKLERTFRRAPVAASAIEIYDMTLDHVQVGDLSLRGVHMLVVPHRAVPKGGSEGVCAKEAAKDQKAHPEKYQNAVEALPLPLDGILGMDYLREFALLIDFQREQITGWAYGNLQPDDLAANGMDGATVVPLETDHQHLNANFVKVGFETPAGRVVEKEEVDTGAETTMMTPHHADQIKVAVTRTFFLETFYGCLPFSSGTIQHIDLDGVIVNDRPVGFTRKAPAGFPLLLGYDVFSQCRVLFDFPAGKMYIRAIPDIEKFTKPAAQFSDPLPYAPGPNGEIFLTFRFDGAKTATFALDTGAERTVVAPGLAASLGLSLTPLLDAGGSAALYEGSPLMAGKLPVMRFGGMGVAGFDCAAAHDPITVAGRSVDGVLGGDFCAAFLPYIDFQKHQVTFLQGRALDAGDLEKLGMSDAAQIILDQPAPNQWDVSGEINQGKTLDEPFTVSTLAPATVLSSRVVQALALKAVGPASQALTTIDAFTLAGIPAPGGMRYALQEAAAPTPASVIGLDYLSHYRLLLDIPNGRLYLANPAKDSAAPATDPSPVAAPAAH